MSKVVNLEQWKKTQARIAAGHRLAAHNREAKEERQRLAAFEEIERLIKFVGLTKVGFAEILLEVMENNGYRSTMYKRIERKEA